MSALFGKSLIKIADLHLPEIEAIVSEARRMRSAVLSGRALRVLEGRIMTALFYEPSSRTFGSFLAAMQRLGGGIIPIQGVAYSSVVKGESLKDTIETFSRLSDIVVLRHPEIGSADVGAKSSKVPVINAGDGAGEHPTQALLDLFTVKDHFDDLSNLTITFVGDLLYGRTVHSLHALMSLYHPKKIHFISPSELAMPGVAGSDNLEEVLPETDVLYMTRVQKERFPDPAVYERLKDSFRVTQETMAKLPKNAIVMHPFPRVNEISQEVDSDPRALYLREQIPNGLYVRMALLSLILNKTLSSKL